MLTGVIPSTTCLLVSYRVRYVDGCHTEYDMLTGVVPGTIC